MWKMIVIITERKLMQKKEIIIKLMAYYWD